MPSPKASTRSRHLRATVVVYLLTGFDRFLENVEPDEARRILELFRTECDQAVRVHGGSIFSQQGARVCGFFGASSLALSALLASDRLLARWQALGEQPPLTELPAICAAVHTDAFVLLDADTLLGSGMELAHRFAEAGVGGEVVTSEATLEAITATLPPGWRAEKQIGEENGADERCIDLMVNNLLPLSEELARRVIRVGPERGPAKPSTGGSVEFHYWMETPVRGIGGPSIPILRIRSDLQRPPAGSWSGEKPSSRAIQFGKYELVRKIGEGGMGSVWLARDRFGNRVAIKQLLQHLNPNSTQLKRFRREAEVMAQLSHRNIVRIHEVGSVDGVAFFAMEYLEGASLAEVLSFSTPGPVELGYIVSTLEAARSSGDCALETSETADQAAETVRTASPPEQPTEQHLPEAHRSESEPASPAPDQPSPRAPNRERLAIPVPQAIGIIMKVCEGVEFAHEHGVLHRDLKPGNIMIRGDGEAVVMDFGLAKQLSDDGPDSISLSGCIVGTLDYMAPEQAANSKRVSAQADVYSLGAILYEMLTGRKAFMATGNLAADLATLRHHTPTAPRVINKLIDRDLEIITLKAMQPEPEQRYASAKLLGEDLRRYLAGEPIQARETTLRYLLQRRIRRNPTAFAAGAILGSALLIVSLIFTARLLAEGKRAERLLVRLRGTAPDLAAKAKSLVDNGEFDEAIKKIGYVIDLDPTNLDYVLFRANTLEAAQRLGAAAAEYRRILAVRPDPVARLNLQLCERLLAKAGPSGQLGREQQIELVASLIAQHRPVEAAPLSVLLGRDADAIESAIRIRLKEYGSQVDWYDKRIERLPDSTFKIDLARLQLGDLTKLKGLPISQLFLDSTSFANVKEIASLPLRKLSLDNTNVKELEPLHQTALQWLRISTTSIADLTPLNGMPLEFLDLAGCRSVSDLTPLRNAPIHRLFVSFTSVRDLSPLAEMPLEELSAVECTLNDLNALQGKSLAKLNLQNSRSPLDLTPLASCPNLQTIVLPIDPVSVNALRGLKSLRVIDWDKRGVYQAPQFWQRFGPCLDPSHPAYRAISAAGVAHIPFGAIEADPSGALSLDLHDTSISNLRPLKDLPINSLILCGTKVTDLSPLRGKNLQVLRCDGAPVGEVTPLSECPDLQQLTIPTNAVGIGVLRALPKLKYISYGWNTVANRPADTVADFWARYGKRRQEQAATATAIGSD